MSDTQGYDTASGGLENDMPGLETAPASPRMVPSALGGIANYARQALGVGAPAPQALRPGRSPFQFPGQSQIPQAPPQPNTPRWEGTTASLYLPRHSLQPPARFTPFRGSLPTADWRQWGQPEEFPNLPQSHELPGVTMGLSRFFGQMGGGLDRLAVLAMAMGGHADDYIKGVMLGQEYRSKIAKERWLEKSMELQDQLEKRHTLYADDLALFNEYTNGDPTKLDTVRIKGESWRDRLHRDAMQTDDKDVIQMLEDGQTAQQIMDYQNVRDGRLKDLQKVNEKAQQQEAEDNKERADAGLPPEPSKQSTTDPLAPRPRDDQTGIAPQPVVAGGPAPTQTPQGPQVAGGAGGDQSQAPLLPYQEQGNEFTKGEIGVNSIPKAIRPDVTNWAAQQMAKVDRVRNDWNARKIADNQLPAELDKIIPGMGEDYANTLNGAPLPAGAAGRSPYWQSIKNMIPGFNPIVQAQTLRDFAPGGKDAARITAGVRMSDAAITVLKEMKNFNEGDLPPQNVINQWIATGVTGDPKWSNLFAAVNVYMQEHQNLQSPTGRFFEGEMKEQRANLRITLGLRAIRGLLKVDARNAGPLVEQLRNNYRRGSRHQDDPPTYDPQKAAILDALTNLDENKGFQDIPQDRLPEPLRGLGLGQQAGNGSFKLPPGVTITPLP